MAKRNRKEARPDAEAHEAEAGGGNEMSESQGDTPATDTPPVSAKPEPEWKARIARAKAAEDQSFEIVPGTWFDRQTPRIKTITRRELARRGHNAQRLASVGVIRMIDQKSEADA